MVFVIEYGFFVFDFDIIVVEIVWFVEEVKVKKIVFFFVKFIVGVDFEKFIGVVV